MDFADFRLPWGKRHALIVVLGYSRWMWLRFYERQTMPAICPATIKVRTRGRDATSGKTMAVWGTRSKRMGDGGVSETVGMRRPAART